MNANVKIDFVIPWVDNSDQEWIKKRAEFSDEDTGFMNRKDSRYRDLGLLRYWFRAVDLYAPWVNKIHFVTCGHYPDWLNLDHPKINLVKHEDYIPSDYLPTFSSHPIELNLHRIAGLEEYFVYFNDDVFVNAPVTPKDFFAKGLPKDVAVRSIPVIGNSGNICMNEINIINRELDFWASFKKNIFKWLNYRYGIYNLRTLMLLPHRDFTGVKNLHVANSYKKSTYEEVWEKCPVELDQTCRHRFRNQYDVNQWLMKYWQLVSGGFSPQCYSFGKQFDMRELVKISETVNSSKCKLICLHDSEDIDDFQSIKDAVISIFQKKFPAKSSFEL